MGSNSKAPMMAWASKVVAIFWSKQGGKNTGSKGDPIFVGDISLIMGLFFFFKGHVKSDDHFFHDRKRTNDG